MKNIRLSPTLLVLIVLMGIGLIQIFSASFIFASETYQDGFYFLKKQLLFTLVGVALMVAGAKIPLRAIERWSFLLWPLGILFLVLTLIPGIGVKVGGAHRWLSMPGGFRFEPSEMMKVSFCLFVSSLFVRQSLWLKKVPVIVILLVLLIPFFLLHRQPDFGSIAILSLIGFGVLFAFGLSTKLITLLGSLMGVLFYFLVMRVPYRRDRVMAFFDPWSDPEQKGFQSIQSMLTFHSGGIFGTGLGQGQGKLFFLPEAHTDFTLAVFGEEWGFVGFVVLLSLYGYLTYRCLSLSVRTQNLWQRVYCLSASIYFAISVFINMGVVLGMLPTKGLTLPFLSYGGSSLVSFCLLFGVVLNIESSLESSSEAPQDTPAGAKR